METIIKTQKLLDNLIEHCPMYANIYYDNQMNFIPIDWNNEYIQMIDDDGHVTLKRIHYTVH